MSIAGPIGAQTLTYSAIGKFTLGETIMFQFMAKFHDIGLAQMCNDVEALGENPTNIQ